MKHIKLFFTFILFVSNALYGQFNEEDSNVNKFTPDSAKVEIAKTLALDFIRILTHGEHLDSMQNICELPFAWDRKRIIDNWTDFNASLQSIVNNKGKNRSFLIDTVFHVSSKYEMIDKMIPIHVYYIAVSLTAPNSGSDKKHWIYFAVQISDEPKIIGFND